MGEEKEDTIRYSISRYNANGIPVSHFEYVFGSAHDYVLKTIKKIENGVCTQCRASGSNWHKLDCSYGNGPVIPAIKEEDNSLNTICQRLKNNI